MEEDHGESTVMTVAARVSTGASALLWLRQPSRSGLSALEVVESFWNTLADGRMASALLNCGVMDRNLDGCGGEPNRPGF
jgi:hypothetical protein